MPGFETKAWSAALPGIGEVELRGFMSGKGAKKHALKHFLNPIERWEQCLPPRKPAEFREKLAGEPIMPGSETLEGVTKEGQKVLVEAAKAYQDTVVKVNLSNSVRKSLLHTGCSYGKIMYIVSNFGVFSVFLVKKKGRSYLSDLMTSYRPVRPGGNDGRSVRHYMNACLRKLAKIEQGRGGAYRAPRR